MDAVPWYEKGLKTFNQKIPRVPMGCKKAAKDWRGRRHELIESRPKGKDNNVLKWQASKELTVHWLVLKDGGVLNWASIQNADTNIWCRRKYFDSKS